MEASGGRSGDGAPLNIDGDGQGDTNGHGGEQRAVLVYQIQSYRYWQRYLGRDDLGYGQFGENLTVDGLTDDEVCIGDRYRIGEAEFEVTQPRVTCYRVGLRVGVTPRTRWNPRPTARCSSAAPSPAATSSWTCEPEACPFRWATAV